MKNKIKASLLITIISLFILSCASNQTKNPIQQSTPPVAVETEVDKIKTLFVEKCEACHGSDGTAGIANAANLQTSKLDSSSTIQIILNGKGSMPAFNSQLNESELHKLANYVYTLRK